MSGEKFQLDLTGRPLDGYRTEDVAAALARLLRIPRKRARNLLRGTPSRIKLELEKEKAIHLMGKLLACGAQCEITAVKIHDDRETTEATIDLPENLELEIDQQDVDLGGETDGSEAEPQPGVMEGDQASLQSEQHTPPEKPEVSPLDNNGAEHAQQVKELDEEAVKAPATIGGRRQRVFLYAAVTAVLIGVAVWAGLTFFGGSVSSPEQKSAEKASAQTAVPKIVSQVAQTKRRLELLTRSVRIWMIQYGAGFDPSQVTMARIQQDLEISSKEMQDGWGTPFHYSTAAGAYTITSAGPDQVFDSEDDISVKKSAQ